MAGNAVELTLLGPSPVAVHDDGYMLRQIDGIHGRTRAAFMSGMLPAELPGWIVFR